MCCGNVDGVGDDDGDGVGDGVGDDDGDRVGDDDGDDGDGVGDDDGDGGAHLRGHFVNFFVECGHRLLVAFLYV